MGMIIIDPTTGGGGGGGAVNVIDNLSGSSTTDAPSIRAVKSGLSGKSDNGHIHTTANITGLDTKIAQIDANIAAIGPGIPGAAATIQVGSVNTVPFGTPANVVNVGTTSAAKFDFDIPQGAPGSGSAGPTVHSTLTGLDYASSGHNGFASDTDPRLSDSRPASDVSAWAKQPSKPAYNTSELTNDAGFITNLATGLANYYDKTTVDTIISSLNKISVEIVPSLPTSNIDTSVIYLIEKDPINNIYTQHMYIGGAWATLGDTSISLVLASITNDGLMSSGDKISLEFMRKPTIFSFTGADYEPMTSIAGFDPTIYPVLLVGFNSVNLIKPATIKINGVVYTLKLHGRDLDIGEIYMQEIAFIWFNGTTANIFAVDTDKTKLLLKDGSVPLDIAYAPTNNQDIATKQYVDNADTVLGNAIEDIATANNIIDIVPTHAALLLYNTTKVKPNDIIVVSADETHGGAKSFYKWLKPSTSFQWVYQLSETIKATQAYVDARAVPVGGATGQALVKKSGTDRDVEWQTVSGGGGTVGNYVPLDVNDKAPAEYLPSNVSIGTAAFAAGKLTLDVLTGSYFEHTFTANTEIAFSNVPTGVTTVIMLKVTNGGNFNVTYPATTIFPNAYPVYRKDNYDYIMFILQDPTNIMCFPLTMGFRSEIADGTKTYAAGTLTLDVSSGSVFSHSCTENTTIMLSNYAGGANEVVLLKLYNGGSFAVTHPINSKFTSGIAPILTINSTDYLFYFVQSNGTIFCEQKGDVR